MSFTYPYARPAVTVDTAVIAADKDGKPHVLLIKRGRKGTPFYGCWALPGGFVNDGEDLEVAARRELREETHVEAGLMLQVRAFGTPGRDPRGHVISVVFMTVKKMDDVNFRADDDAKEAAWWPLDGDKLPELAFDHRDILEVVYKQLNLVPMKLDKCPQCGNKDLSDRWSSKGKRLLEQHCDGIDEDEVLPEGQYNNEYDGWGNPGRVCNWVGEARTPEVQKIKKTSSHRFNMAGSYSIYDRFGHTMCLSQGFGSKKDAMPHIQKYLKRGVTDADAGPYTALWWASAGAYDRATEIKLIEG